MSIFGVGKRIVEGTRTHVGYTQRGLPRILGILLLIVLTVAGVTALGSVNTWVLVGVFTITIIILAAWLSGSTQEQH